MIWHGAHAYTRTDDDGGRVPHRPHPTLYCNLKQQREQNNLFKQKNASNNGGFHFFMFRSFSLTPQEGPLLLSSANNIRSPPLWPQSMTRDIFLLFSRTPLIFFHLLLTATNSIRPATISEPIIMNMVHQSRVRYANLWIHIIIIII